MDRPRFRLSGPTIGAREPLALASFYSELLGWPIERSEGPRVGRPANDGWALLRSPDGRQKIEVQWEPHARPPTWPAAAGDVAMLMHLDIGVDDIDAGVRWVLQLGASEAVQQPQPGVRVMLDPEGNPFCLFPDA